MGNLIKSIYDKNPEIALWKELFIILRLTQSDVKKLLKQFHIIDADNSYTVSLHELINHLGMENTSYAKRVFGMFDTDASGTVDFGEFVAALWNYCSLEKNDLVAFTFDLYDADGSGVIESMEIQQILFDAYGKKFSQNKHAQGVFAKISKQGYFSCDAAAFAEFVAKHPALLFPAFMAQDKIRSNIMGNRFWKAITQTRANNKDNITMDKIRKLLRAAKRAHKRGTNTLTISVQPLNGNASPANSKVEPSSPLKLNIPAQSSSRLVKGKGGDSMSSIDTTASLTAGTPKSKASSRNLLNNCNSASTKDMQVTPKGSHRRTGSMQLAAKELDRLMEGQSTKNEQENEESNNNASTSVRKDMRSTRRKSAHVVQHVAAAPFDRNRSRRRSV